MDKQLFSLAEKRLFIRIFFLFVLLNFLLFFRLITLDKKTCILEIETKGNKQTETVQCGVVRRKDNYTEFLGKLEKIVIDKNQLVQLRVKLFSDTGKLYSQKLAVGLKGKDYYVFVKIRQKPALFDTEETKNFILPIDEDFIRKLSKLKGEYFLFTVNTGKQFLNAKIEKVKKKYKKNAEFKINYYKKCFFTLSQTKKNYLLEIEKKCGYVYIDSIVFFNSGLEL